MLFPGPEADEDSVAVLSQSLWQEEGAAQSCTSNSVHHLSRDTVILSKASHLARLRISGAVGSNHSMHVEGEVTCLANGIYNVSRASPPSHLTASRE